MDVSKEGISWCWTMRVRSHQKKMVFDFGLAVGDSSFFYETVRKHLVVLKNLPGM